MGMSTRVEGFKPADEKWEKMKAVWDACTEAKIDVPEGVLKFFNHDGPDDAGVKVELAACYDEKRDHGCITRSGGFGYTSYEIDLKKLPADVTIVRFTNSW